MSDLRKTIDGLKEIAASPRKQLDRVLAGENVLDNEKAAALLDRCSMEAFRQRVVEFFKSL